MCSDVATHSHDHGSSHVHATIDHLASEQASSLSLLVRLDRALMGNLNAAEGSLVRLSTDRGRSLVARLSKPLSQEEGAGTIRLDRFARQALKAHLNEPIEIERAVETTATSVVLRPAVDVSMAHDLVPHLKRCLIEARTPITTGSILYIPFPKSSAGITYEAKVLRGAPGIVTAETDVTVDYHDSHLPEGAFDITYEDVGGLTKQIRLIRELVQLPLRFPHVYRQLGIAAPRGIILYGPPGSGKTHLARAVANEVDARFYYINGPDVVGTYTGETEANLRRMFAEASHHAPSIIFIDELDSIAPKRGETGAHADTRAVTQLLSLMDGLTRVDSVIVIGTTNRVDSVDAALRRPGRFDREIFIGPPDAAGRLEILGIHTREMPLSDACTTALPDVARRTHGFLGADIMELCRTAGLNALRRGAGTLSDHRSAFRIEIDDLRIEPQDFEGALAETRPSALRETLISIPDVRWDEIGGLQTAKLRLQEAVEAPLRNPQLLMDVGLPPHSGVLLYGPPGTGKTLLAKAIANECGVNFIAVNGSELFTKWLGESEEGVRQVFRIARQVAPAVIFFDQLESLAPIRGRHDGSMTTERVVGQLLAEMDGMAQLSRVVVIGATNRLDLVDPSVLRAGRLGTHIEVGLPDEGARADILQRNLTRLTEDASEVIAELAAKTEAWSGAELRELCDAAKRAALKRVEFKSAAAPTRADLIEALTSTEPKR
jgi:transitional endoplasmic reticulum ATPase